VNQTMATIFHTETNNYGKSNPRKCGKCGMEFSPGDEYYQDPTKKNAAVCHYCYDRYKKISVTVTGKQDSFHYTLIGKNVQVGIHGSETNQFTLTLCEGHNFIENLENLENIKIDYVPYWIPGSTIDDIMKIHVK
jgi:hypothetical protein